MIITLICSLLMYGCGGGGGSLAPSTTDARSSISIDTNRSVRLNNYGSFALAKPPDHLSRAKLEAALAVLAKRDNICIGENWQYVNGTPGFVGLTPYTIKKLNPQAKVYELWDLMCKNEWDTDWQVDNPESLKDWRMQTPLTWREIENNDWWLRDGNGNKVHEAGRPDIWYLDVGKPGFKEAYLRGVLKRMSNKGYDGPMFDYWWPGIEDILSCQGLPMPSSYANDDEWFEKAWKPFIKYVMDGVHAAGYRIIGNCVGEYGESDPKKIWQRSMVDGVNYEQWALTFYPGTWLPGHIIERRIKNAPLDPLEVVITDSGLRSDDPEYERKHLVSLGMYYIAMPPTQNKRTYGNCYDKLPHWKPIWDFYIGQPSTEAAVKHPSKYFWSRKFSQGMVLLNYEEAESISFTLDRKYKDSAGKVYSGTVTLPAHTALILAVEGT